MEYSFHVSCSLYLGVLNTEIKACARREGKVIDLCLGSLLNFLSQVCVGYLKSFYNKIDFSRVTTIRLWFLFETSCAKILGRTTVQQCFQLCLCWGICISVQDCFLLKSMIPAFLAKLVWGKSHCQIRIWAFLQFTQVSNPSGCSSYPTGENIPRT